MPVDQGAAPWTRGVLQALLLRYRVAPVHGDDAQPRVRQQVRVLLAASHKPGWPRVAVEDGRRGGNRREGVARAPRDDQADEGRPGGHTGAVRRGYGPEALRVVAGGRAHHVPRD